MGRRMRVLCGAFYARTHAHALCTHTASPSVRSGVTSSRIFGCLSFRVDGFSSWLEQDGLGGEGKGVWIFSNPYIMGYMEIRWLNIWKLKIRIFNVKNLKCKNALLSSSSLKFFVLERENHFSRLLVKKSILKITVTKFHLYTLLDILDDQ